MNQNVIFNTACGSRNMGDYIIYDSIKRELNSIIENNFLVEYATHTPVSHWYQNTNKNPIYKYCQEAQYKFISGTNILQYHMMRPWANWNVNIFNYKPYRNSILVGVGVNPNRPSMDTYTKYLYRKILSPNYIHSARDERTKEIIESLGFQAINTGCATTWMLTKQHCAKIPTKKASNVIFTLTDYHKNPVQDQLLINILLNNYNKVSYWVQGSEDFAYLTSLEHTEKLTIIPPHLSAYQHALTSNSADYVGTRLHAGIFAMQNFVRSVIISIDNRTRDMRESCNLNTIERKDIKDLPDLIYSNITTKINLKEDGIKAWKEQF